MFFGALGYLHLARQKFTWWRRASFAGRVVGKEARARDSDAVVPEAAATEQPTQHRFYLHIQDGEGATATHQVVPAAFRQVAVGDRVAKAAGSYEVRRLPAPAPPPGSHESPADVNVDKS